MTPQPNTSPKPLPPLRVTLRVVGALIVAAMLVGRGLPAVTRWIGALGGILITVLAPAAARAMVTSVALTEEGVTGAGFLSPVHIPWAEVVRVCDDPNGIDVQSAARSARINLSNVTVSGPGGRVELSNFANADEMVRFILAHVPKSSILEIRHWMPN